MNEEKYSRYIDKKLFKEFENEIYLSFDYDMGISNKFIKFLEENNIISRHSL